MNQNNIQFESTITNHSQHRNFKCWNWTLSMYIYIFIAILVILEVFKPFQLIASSQYFVCSLISNYEGHIKMFLKFYYL